MEDWPENNALMNLLTPILSSRVMMIRGIFFGRVNAKGS